MSADLHLDQGPCAVVRPLLAGFVGEELPQAQLDEVQAHLRVCVPCRREAADFLQAGKALQAAALDVAARDDVPFDEMHRDIMAAVTEAAERGDAPQLPVRGMRLMVFAAAVMLAAFGFWLAAKAQPDDSIWDRPGMSGPVADTVFADGVDVLPYAGTPAEIRPVGLDEPGSAESGLGTGMAARGSLRHDVEILPAVYREPRRVR